MYFFIICEFGLFPQYPKFHKEKKKISNYKKYKDQNHHFYNIGTKTNFNWKLWDLKHLMEKKSASQFVDINNFIHFSQKQKK